MDAKFVSTFNEAESFITGFAFPPSSAGSDHALFALAASEDDHIRLYDLEYPVTLANSPSFLVADYHLPATGCDKVTFTQGNTHCLVAPRLRGDRQLYCMNLETGTLVSSYDCSVHQNYQDPLSIGSGRPGVPASVPQYQPWFGSLVVHPKAPGVFASQGDGSVVNFFSASVSVPVARLSTPSKGRAVIAFSPRDGNFFAVGDAEGIGIYDWRKIGATTASASSSATTTSPAVLHIAHKKSMQAARWLQDVGYVSGLDFSPVNDRHLLVTTSRFVVRTLDMQSGAPIHSFGASGAAASHLPNERPQAMSNRRVLPTAAKFSPDGKYVAVGSMLRRTCVFETPAAATSATEDVDTASGTPVASAATLSHVLSGTHEGAVSNVEWNHTVPLLSSTCRVGNNWRFVNSKS